jgi:hypothetical protein
MHLYSNTAYHVPQPSTWVCDASPLYMRTYNPKRILIQCDTGQKQKA